MPKNEAPDLLTAGVKLWTALKDVGRAVAREAEETWRDATSDDNEGGRPAGDAKPKPSTAAAASGPTTVSVPRTLLHDVIAATKISDGHLFNAAMHLRKWVEAEYGDL